MPNEIPRRLIDRKQRLNNPPVFTNARYVDIQRHWKRLKPLFQSDEARNIWHPCLMEFATDRGERNGFPFVEQARHRLPTNYDNSDWRCMRRRPQPEFWDYACHAACHWLVDLGLFVAFSAWPKQPWRILTCNIDKLGHSTVWNGDLQSPLLFDINYSAMKIPASEALEKAWIGRELRIGLYLKGYMHDD